jgi:calcineurin-like phosphoesterase family protein
VNPNLFVWTSDWHVGRQAAYHTQGAAAHIASLAPAGVIDTGDCKDHYGVASVSEHTDYEAQVENVLPWAWVNAGSIAQHPILPGNHDEMSDYPLGASDFSLFDSDFWGPPYHWTCDWQAPQVRFIGFHARIAHPIDHGAQYQGYFIVTQAERDWLEAELVALPEGWQAIVCCHAPLASAFGNQIGYWANFGGAELRTLLQGHSARVAAYLGGHRHANMNTAVLDGITHFNGPGVSYTQGNGYGGFVLIDYAAAARTLAFRYHYARAPFAAFTGYTSVVIQLPPLPNVSSYIFAVEATLLGAGPLSGRNVTISGTLDAEDETPTGTTCSVELTE